MTNGSSPDRATGPDRRIVESIAEGALPPSRRQEAATLLAAEWGDDWKPNGYAGEHPPAVRVLGIDTAGALIGHLSLFEIPTEPPLALVGFGDLVVAPRARGRGLARALAARGAEHPLARAADVLLVDTVDAAAAFRALGFRPVVPWSVFYEADDACHRHPYWLIAARAALPERLELLENGDF